MNILRTLPKPFALVGEGFVAVDILFYATIPADPETTGPGATAAVSAQEISEA